ncbi:hypothetical protein IFM89_001768 [Coptis chinensis]|uniref:KIB1-4 beta-propeller domain-containing protein n=1 Tax=Coptis chinensis TaxID=261450 RepID=A0A835HK59_9MAGN|nr:hypothetical protein IFM89_001768 [Coptis chinensis]
MNQQMVLSRWSELAPELLDFISKKLTNYVDYVRVRAVCPSWRSNLPKKPFHLLTQLPWLLLPQFNTNTISETYCSFFNLVDNKTYRLELPEVLGKGKKCWGSPHGWLVVLREEGPSFSLLNPLTRAQIHLPSLYLSPSTSPIGNIVLPWDYVGYLRNCCVVKAVLFANPSESTDFVVMVILEEGPCGLAFYKSGTVAWILITDTEDIIFQDIVCFKGQFYAADSKGNVYICNIGASPNVVKVADPSGGLPCDEPQQRYLVESGKELLMLYRYQLPKTPYDLTYYFTLSKLDLSEAKWSRVVDLGDKGLFLGTNCSYSVSVREYRSCIENSVYFTDDMRHRLPGFGDCRGLYPYVTAQFLGVFNVFEDGYFRFMNGRVRGYDFGVFSIDKGITDPLPCPIPNPNDIRCILPPPVWVTLSP